MKKHRSYWAFLGLLLLAAGAWLLWHRTSPAAAHKQSAAPIRTVRSASTAPRFMTTPMVTTNAAKAKAATAKDKFAYRLSNTPKPIGELVHDNHAILLENAFIDTRLPLNFSIPKNLQATGDPGAYIVQARGPIDGAFRAMLAAAGATIVSYIPNNAYLVRASAGQIANVTGNPLTQSVVPYEPYYKVQAPLLAYDQGSLPDGTPLTLGLFGDDAPATLRQIQNLGWHIFSRDTSPFGSIVRVTAAQTQNWTALAALPGVQIVESYHPRVPANDLARVTLGISTNTITSTNYMNLYGSNVVVEVNDTGIDAGHPDLSGRVLFDVAASGTDTNGHGTHVAGIIAGSGAESSTINQPPYLPQGSVTNADFRGKAPDATLYSVGFLGASGEVADVSDSYLQQAAALTNALISNNSWGSEGDDTYNLESASFDAAVRDALPNVTGSQPVLFVFAAGNDGGGNNNGGGGTPDTISAPATAKDVITVGATEQLRNITNIVTALNGSSNAVWQPMTDTSYQVADYSSRGNVGVGIEGAFGRYKPDVVAPGTFVVSTRSEQWDTNAYYNPTNFSGLDYSDQVVGTNAVSYFSVDLSTTPNVVGVTIEVVPNRFTTGSLNLPVYVSSVPDINNNYPDPANNTGAGAFITPPPTNTVIIPPAGGAGYLTTAVANGGFNFAVGNPGPQPANFDLLVELTTTNDNGNYYQVLQQLNDSLGKSPHYYRYETGTSMAAPAISGLLALMQDFFTNQWHTLPSPALLKAMVINGARPTSTYNLQVQNSINLEGWGLANLPDSLPYGLSTNLNTACSSFIQDQSPANALATGDRRTFYVNVSSNALTQPLRVTLAWTDPPGNPAAATKLVNDLNLAVTNLDDPANPVVYYGNDIGANQTFNSGHSTNTPPNLDDINNVENVYLPAGAGTNFAITVTGYRVNVNAVTAQTNNAVGTYAPNIVQDYALVVASGNGLLTNAITVTASPIVSNPTGDQQITIVTNGNVGTLQNQTVGANSPVIATNAVLFSTNNPEGIGPNAWQVTIGQTNQWHFYVATNVSDFTNAAFITYIPETLSIPREGVFANSQANATRPEADIDIYVSTLPGLTNLDPNVISNCVHYGQVNGGTGGGAFYGSSLSRGGTEFVVDTNSPATAAPHVYYIGVKSEDQTAALYNFLSVFTDQPFSTPNGDATGVPAPALIPDGNPAVPGYVDVVALELYPMSVLRAVVTNEFTAQNFGDLVGAINHNDTSVILNNHDSINFPITNQDFIYDDSGFGDITNSQPSDGPGSLNDFLGKDGSGVWILHESDNAAGFTNIIDRFNLHIDPNNNLNGTNSPIIPSSGWFYGYVDVPPGATNLTILATNISAVVSTPPLEMFVRYGALPTTSVFDEMTNFNGTPPTALISIGPPITAGRYYVGVYNPSATAQTIFITAIVSGPSQPQTIYSSSGPVPLLDDAVTTNTIAVTQDKTIASVDVALRVDHPRVSDLVFHLISPDGTRVLLVENRGGATPNGMGITLGTNSIVEPQTSSGGPDASTNVINTGQTAGTLTVQYNFYTIPDEMLVLDAGGNTNFDSGLISGSGVFNIPYTNAPLTIIMNPGGNSAGGSDLWDYTVDATGPSYEYLTLTEDTNKTTTPIKFALPPFIPGAASNLFVSGFDSATATNYLAGSTFNDGTNVWGVTSNQVSVMNDPATADAGSSQFLALANGTITNILPTVAGQTYVLTFRYRGPGIVGWWRGEDNYTDSIYGNNGTPQLITFAPGEVGDAFVSHYTAGPPQSAISITDQPIFYLTNSLSIDGWIKSAGATGDNGEILWRGDNRAGYDPYFFQLNGDNTLGFGIGNAAGVGANLNTTVPLPPNQWFHVAATLDGNSGTMSIYTNGVLAAQTNTAVRPFGALIPGDEPSIGIGNTGTASWRYIPFNGDLDEISLYSRAMSASEVQAIYADGINGNVQGGNGKFDPAEFNNVSPAQSLAEAQISIDGGAPATFFGNNTNWQTKTIVFTATTNGTPLQLTGLEPGMLMDSFTLSKGSGDLYYLPEQSLDTFDGEDAHGLWTLEVQDDRAGATNPAPSLLSWQLRFNFTTPTTPASSIGTLTNGVPLTNSIPGNSIAYYLVNVPTNADSGTNSLSMTNGPLSLWFNPTTLPTGTNPPDYLLFSSSTSTNSILGTNATPPYFTPGGYYYLAVQNTNAFAVNYDIAVNFHLVLPPPTSPITNYPISGITFTNENGTNGILLTWFAPTNYQFYIQWTRSLSPSPIAWTTVPGVLITTPVSVTGSTGTYQWFDDFTLTGGFGTQKFYRLIAYPPGVAIPFFLFNVQASPGGGVQLQWNGSTNYLYDVLWSTSLALPTTSWNVLSNLAPPTLTNAGGVFTFTTNTVTLTGGAPNAFFQVLELP